MTELRHSILTIDGVRTPVCEAGPEGASEAVVCVHGNPGSGEDWEFLLPSIGELARIVAPDMPGYGRADRPRDFPYTVEGYGRHLERLLAQLGITRAHLVVHDFGGPWGLWWAAEHPERVASLTLFDIGVLPGYRWHKLARIWRAPVLGELFMMSTSRPALRLLLNLDNPKPLPAAFIARMAGYVDAGLSRAVLALYRATPDLAAVTVELGQRLAPHAIPALVIWGEDDAYLPSRFAEAQRDYFDVRGLHRLPQCGHWPMVDEPDRVRELVVEFLRELLGAEDNPG